MPINNDFNKNYGFSLNILIVCLAVLVIAGIAISLKDSKLPWIFQANLNQSNTQNNISDWKTETNDQYGISFKLPKDWGSTDLSNTLIIAPQKTVDEVRGNVEKGLGFGGGTFLTMQISFMNGDYPSDAFKSDQNKTVSSKEVTVGGKKATEYTTTYITSLPGIEKGSIIKAYVVEANGEKYVIDLLDKGQFDTLDKIVSSISFVASKDPLSGKTKEEITGIKGKPSNSAYNKQTKKEVWVYINKGDEASGTYVYFLNDQVSETGIDEYNGTLESNSWIK